MNDVSLAELLWKQLPLPEKKQIEAIVELLKKTDSGSLVTVYHFLPVHS